MAQPLQALDSMQAAMEAKPRRGIAGQFVRRLLSLPARFPQPLSQPGMSPDQAGHVRAVTQE